MVNLLLHHQAYIYINAGHYKAKVLLKEGLINRLVSEM